MDVKWLVNGEAGAGVDPADRGLAYGDGLFETMRVRAGNVPRLGYHLERLAEGCDRLAIPRPGFGLIEAEIEAAVAGVARGVAKLVVTRGSGGRGYGPPAEVKPARMLGVFPWPDYGVSHYTRGIVLRSLDSTIGENKRLAGLKHLCRLEQVLARIELAEGEAKVDEGLMKRAGGEIVGGTSTNLFAVRGGSVLTPAVEKCGVRGVMRRIVIEACGRLEIPVTEAEFQGADLESADELFVTNAVAGIRPVRELDGRAYEIGPIANALIDEVDVDA